MFKAIGVCTVLALGGGAVLWYGGYLDGKARVSLTDKGRGAVNNGLDHARDGLNTGLEKLKVEHAPQLKAGDD